ncbi:hypothetical protein, partial [[Ruminococcus] torques]
SEYTAKAFTEPRDYRVVFLIQSPEVPKGTFRDCNRSPLKKQDTKQGILFLLIHLSLFVCHPIFYR